VSVGRPSTCHRDRCAIDGPVRAGPGDPPWTLRVPITAACRRSCCTSSPWHNRPPRQGQVDSSEVQCSAVQCSAVECSHVQSNATKLSWQAALDLAGLITTAQHPSSNLRPGPLARPGLHARPGRAMAGLWPGYGRAHGTTAAAPPAPACELTKSSICLRSSAFGSRCTEERGKLVSGDVWLIWSQCRIAGRS